MGDGLKLKVAFRTTGNQRQGMGDVYGSLALADAFKKYAANILFVINNDMETIDVLSHNSYLYEVISHLNDEIEIYRNFSPEIIIVNRLNNSAVYLKKIKNLTKLLVTVDDAGPAAQIADLRINPLYYIENSYTGPDYVALRKEFQEINNIPRRIRKNVESILVTLGGSDTYGFTPKVIKALANIPESIGIDVVLGPAFIHHEELNQVLKSVERHFNIIQNPKNICSLMQKADIAISGGGNTMFELAAIGVPTVVVCGEPFEEETADRMMGVVINLGFGEKVSEKQLYQSVYDLINDFAKRKRISIIAQQIVDGKGSKRTVDLILRKLENLD